VTLVEAVGGFREGFEGSQDLDLALRIIERVAPGQVVHIPRILYHWRAIPGSTALENQEKGYASGAAIRAVQAHLERTGQAAEVVPCPDLHIFNAVRYRLPTDHAPGVSVILGGAASRTGADQFAAQLAGSDPGLTPELLPVADDHTLAHALETARLAAAHDLLVFIISPLQTLGADVLRHLVTWAAQPRVGFVAPRVWSPDFRLDHGGVIFHAADGACYLNQDLRRGLYGRGGRAVLHQRLAALSPLMLACRREVLADIGGLDTRFSGPLTLLDACLRADARGLHNVWLPDATVTLPRGVCRGKLDLFKDPALSPDDRAHWLEKWPEPPGAGDYHPALSPDARFHLSERPGSPWI
jgi:O-antigen biosynthesis protein